MPTSVAEVFSGAGLAPSGTVPWSSRVPESGPGVYVVSLSGSPELLTPTFPSCPINDEAIDELLAARPELRMDGVRPTREALKERIASFWLPDEVVVYIGLAGSLLRNRVSQYYRTRLGARKPHAGGWFLKLLTCLPDLTVHFSPAPVPAESESQMIDTFCARVAPRRRAGLADQAHPFPFANLEWPQGTRKRHGISGATGELARRSVATDRAEVGGRSGQRGSDLEEAISHQIQLELRVRGMETVTAVEAARWVDEAGLLKDSPHHPGLPLRNLLRSGTIFGQRQGTNHRWFIDRIAY